MNMRGFLFVVLSVFVVPAVLNAASTAAVPAFEPVSNSPVAVATTSNGSHVYKKDFTCVNGSKAFTTQIVVGASQRSELEYILKSSFLDRCYKVQSGKVSPVTKTDTSATRAGARIQLTNNKYVFATCPLDDKVITFFLTADVQNVQHRCGPDTSAVPEPSSTSWIEQLFNGSDSQLSQSDSSDSWSGVLDSSLTNALKLCQSNPALCAPQTNTGSQYGSATFENPYTGYNIYDASGGDSYSTGYDSYDSYDDPYESDWSDDDESTSSEGTSYTGDKATDDDFIDPFDDSYFTDDELLIYEYEMLGDYDWGSIQTDTSGAAIDELLLYTDNTIYADDALFWDSTEMDLLASQLNVKYDGWDTQFADDYAQMKIYYPNLTQNEFSLMRWAKGLYGTNYGSWEYDATASVQTEQGRSLLRRMWDWVKYYVFLGWVFDTERYDI